MFDLSTGTTIEVMTKEERKAWEKQNGRSTSKSYRGVAPQSRVEFVEAAIAMWEALKGRPATDKEKENFEQRAKATFPD